MFATIRIGDFTLTIVPGEFPHNHDVHVATIQETWDCNKKAFPNNPPQVESVTLACEDDAIAVIRDFMTPTAPESL